MEFYNRGVKRRCQSLKSVSTFFNGALFTLHVLRAFFTIGLGYKMSPFTHNQNEILSWYGTKISLQQS